DLVLVLPEVRQQFLDRSLGMALPAAQPIQCRIDDNALKPRAQSRPALEPADFLEGGEETVLHGVARVLIVTKEAPGDHEQLAAVCASTRLKGGLVARLHPGQQGTLVQTRTRQRG